MARKKKDECCAPTVEAGSCRVEAVVSVDDRGQMVLPKELRERAGIKPSDKLVAATWEKDGQVCCITLVKVEDMVSLLKDKLGPVMREIL
jgi:AbrB family looped-hinge helix DNA binding protein